MVGLSPLSLPIAVDAFFQIFDAFLSLVLVDALLADHQVGRACFSVVLLHH